jgi:hypothetical protein
MPTAALAPSCRRCRSTQFRTREQEFKDGTRHVRQECAGCGKFVRYLPRRDETEQAPRPPRPIQVEILSIAPGKPDLANAVERAMQSLDWLTDAIQDIRRRLDAGEWSDGEPLDVELVAGVSAAAGTAAALLDPARIAAKARARRDGRFAT